MESFELGKKIKKDVFRVVILHGDSELFLCPTLATTRKTPFLKEVSVVCNLNLNLSQLLQFDYLKKLSVLFVYLISYHFTMSHRTDLDLVHCDPAKGKY